MTNQKTIALDLDSVLADVMQIWIEEYNSIFKTNVKKQDIFEWHIDNILPLKNVFKIFYPCLEKPVETDTANL